MEADDELKFGDAVEDDDMDDLNDATFGDDTADGLGGDWEAPGDAVALIEAQKQHGTHQLPQTEKNKENNRVA